MPNQAEVDHLAGRILALEAAVNALLVVTLKGDRESMAQVAVGIQERLNDDALNRFPEPVRKGFCESLDKIIESLSR